LNIESFRNYCIQKKGVTEELPFGPDTLVFKVMGKMFALTNLELFTSINLKCNPEEAIRLRELYTSILPGYHMSKKHWNTILMDGSVNDKLVMKLIDDSYQLVVSGLTKREKAALQELE
jgi:predicted DNA-binding protein (MmcQ/YjbR family)